MERKIQLNIYVPEEYRNILQRLAAERMLRNPKRSVTASKIAVEIIGKYLRNLQLKEKADEVGR